jgi:hypothetical protein
MKTTINNVGIDVLINSKPVKQYIHDGKVFIEAKDGSEYEIQIRNLTPGRIECVVGIDGIDVISGEENTPETTGYIINGYCTLKLDGYRVSSEKVAAFKFCKAGESYSSSKVITAQNGVICISCYAERVISRGICSNTLLDTQPNIGWYASNSLYKNTDPFDTVYYSSTSSSDSQLYGCVSAPSEHFDMGSTFGKSKDSKVVEVSFDRGDILGELSIYYASRQNLKDMGIQLITEKQIVLPQGKKQYCTPPPNWVG